MLYIKCKGAYKTIQDPQSILKVCIYELSSTEERANSKVLNEYGKNPHVLGSIEQILAKCK